MVEKISNNTTPYGKIRASHEGSLHSSTLTLRIIDDVMYCFSLYTACTFSCLTLIANKCCETPVLK